MNKKYRLLIGTTLVLLLTVSALASSNIVSTSSDVGILLVDQNSTEKSSLLLSPTPMSIIKTKVDVSEILNGIWRARDRVNAIAAWITIITFVPTTIFLAYKWQKTKKIEIEKKREERSSFVETGIIKIKKEFEEVSICSVNDYPFKLGGYTVSLKTGESLIIPQPLPDLDVFKYLMIAGWGFAKRDRLFSWENVPGNDSERLLQYLMDDLNIEWAENAEIHKFHDGMSICISKDTNTAEIMMDENKEKAILKITDNRVHNLKVKTENGELNIYEDGKPMADINSQEELGVISFFDNSDQLMDGKQIKIVQPGWTGYRKHINFLDANPDIIYGGDPSIEEIREKGIVGKVKSRYTNIHTHWIDLNIYVNKLEIPKGAKHIKIAVEKPNRTYISLNIAEIIPVTKKEYGKIKKALEKEIQSPTLNPKHNDYAKVKPLLELYQRLRNETTPTDADKRKLWSCARKCIIGKDIYTAYKLIKYALRLETNLDDTYLFSWDNVPGNDSERHLLFLLNDLDINWAKNAEIRKSDDGKIICIFKDENSAEIMINEEKEKATLKIDDGKSIALKVKKENGKLNIYDDTKKKIFEELMSTLKKKAETKEPENESYFKDAVQSCVMLSHFYGLKAKFDHQHEAKWKRKEAECMEEAGKLIEGKVRDVDLYKELMNLQWRCYVSATKKYDKMSDLQKAMEIRVKLNEVFERITGRHPFSSPIIDNVFENYKETTNLIKKCWDDSHGDKYRK